MTCPHCTNSNDTMIEIIRDNKKETLYLCAVCSKTFLKVKK